jgi:hypothetical protein
MPDMNETVHLRKALKSAHRWHVILIAISVALFVALIMTNLFWVKPGQQELIDQLNKINVQLSENREFSQGELGNALEEITSIRQKFENQQSVLLDTQQLKNLLEKLDQVETSVENNRRYLVSQPESMSNFTATTWRARGEIYISTQNGLNTLGYGGCHGSSCLQYMRFFDRSAVIFIDNGVERPAPDGGYYVKTLMTGCNGVVVKVEVTRQPVSNIQTADLGCVSVK